MRKAHTLVTRVYRRVMIASLIATPVFIICISSTEDESGLFDVFGVCLCLSLLSLFSSTFLFFKFQHDFADSRKFLLNWEYPNGDELVIAYKGVLHYSSDAPRPTASVKIDGISWGLENLKEAVEDAANNELGWANLLPSIHVSQTTNVVDNYLPFLWGKVTLGFIETRSQNFLMIVIEIDDSKSSLNFPVPKDVKFGFQNFQDLIYALLEKREIKWFNVSRLEFEEMENKHRNLEKD